MARYMPTAQEGQRESAKHKKALCSDLKLKESMFGAGTEDNAWTGAGREAAGPQNGLYKSAKIR